MVGGYLNPDNPVNVGGSWPGIPRSPPWEVAQEHNWRRGAGVGDAGQSRKGLRQKGIACARTADPAPDRLADRGRSNCRTLFGFLAGGEGSELLLGGFRSAVPGFAHDGDGGAGGTPGPLWKASGPVASGLPAHLPQPGKDRLPALPAGLRLFH